MTRAERWWFVPTEIAPLLGWDAHYVRLMARQCPGDLPFPVVTHGTRTQIPKAPFIEWFLEQGGCADTLSAVIEKISNQTHC